jgi:hypothetical protein
LLTIGSKKRIAVTCAAFLGFIALTGASTGILTTQTKTDVAVSSPNAGNTNTEGTSLAHARADHTHSCTVAGAAQVGCVSVGSQTFAGSKTFNASVTVTATGTDNGVTSTGGPSGGAGVYGAGGCANCRGGLFAGTGSAEGLRSVSGGGAASSYGVEGFGGTGHGGGVKGVASGNGAGLYGLSATGGYGVIAESGNTARAPFKLIGQASAPSSPEVGAMYYDSTSNALKFYNGASWVSASGGSSTASLPAIIEATPATPDARNEYFDGSAFGAWSKTGTWSAVSSFDIYTDDTTANTVKYSWNNAATRSSWLILQPLRNSLRFDLYKSVTLAANDQLYTPFTVGSGGAADSGIGAIALGQASGGVFDINNSVILSVRSTGARSFEARFEVLSGGAYTNLGGPSALAIAPQYLLLVKRGSSYYGFVAYADAQWAYVGSAAVGWTGNVFALIAQNAAGSTALSGGPPVVGFGGVIFTASADLPGLRAP